MRRRGNTTRGGGLATSEREGEYPRAVSQLEPRQRAFVAEYVRDFNATQAAIRAGYTARTANRQGARLLSNDRIGVEIAKAVDKRAKRTEVTADRVVRELARIGFSDLRWMFREDGSLKPPGEWDDEAAAAVASIEVEEIFEGRGADRKLVGYLKKIRLWDKNRALDVLSKHTGVYRDSVNVFVNIINSPQWVELRTVLIAALEPHPKALESVTAAMTALAENAGDSGIG